MNKGQGHVISRLKWVLGSDLKEVSGSASLISSGGLFDTKGVATSRYEHRKAPPPTIWGYGDSPRPVSRLQTQLWCGSKTCSRYFVQCNLLTFLHRDCIILVKYILIVRVCDLKMETKGPKVRYFRLKLLTFIHRNQSLCVWVKIIKPPGTFAFIKDAPVFLTLKEVTSWVEVNQLLSWLLLRYFQAACVSLSYLPWDEITAPCDGKAYNAACRRAFSADK